MSSPQQTGNATQPGEPVSVRLAQPAYEPPAIARIGTLSELTWGGTSGPNDGFGGARAMGSM